MGISEEAKIDAKALEANIAALVEEYEQKHKSNQTQVSVVTRWRDNINDKYSLSKGGAAQVILHDLSHMKKSDKIHWIETTRFIKPIDGINYIHELEGVI